MQTPCDQAKYELLRFDLRKLERNSRAGVLNSSSKLCVLRVLPHIEQDALTHVVSDIEDVDAYWHLYKLETSSNRYIGILVHSPESVGEYSWFNKVT